MNTTTCSTFIPRTNTTNKFINNSIPRARIEIIINLGKIEAQNCIGVQR